MAVLASKHKDFDSKVVVEIILSDHIASVTTTAWRSFASILEVKKVTIKEMEESRVQGILDYGTLFSNLLDNWKLIKGDDATLPNLIDKLHLIGWKEVIDRLRDKNYLPREDNPSPTLFKKHPSYYENFLKSSQKILIISTPSIQITIDRLQVNNPKMILYSGKKFLDQTSMSNICDYPKEQIPVVNCEDGVFRALRGAEVLTGNKIVFVTSEMEDEIPDKLGKFQIDEDSVKLASDSILWNDITPTYQDRIQIVATNVFKVDGDLFRSFMKTNTNKTLFLVNILKSLFLNGSTQIPSESLQNSSSSIVHISRSIVQNHIVSETIFSQGRNNYDDFYFIQIEPCDLPDGFEGDDRIIKHSKQFLNICRDEELTSKSLHLMMSHDEGWK